MMTERLKPVDLLKQRWSRLGRLRRRRWKRALWAAPFASLAWAQASGMIFLGWIRENPLTARPWTMLQYAAPDLPPWQGALMFPGLALMLGAVALISPRKAKLHGDAHFASKAEIWDMELDAPEGVLLGKTGAPENPGGFLITQDPAHFLVIAPTRSGKGVGVIIPNLLAWRGSALCLDIKFENWTETSGFRARYSETFLWAPMAPDGRSHRFNPLDQARRDGRFLVGDVQQIASFLLPVPQGDTFWAMEARNLFAGLALILIWEAGEAGKQATLGEIYRRLLDPDLVANLTKWAKIEGMHPEAARLARNFAAMPDKQRGGVLNNVTSQLGLFANPMVDKATSGSDFSLRDLRRRPISIYVGVTADQMDTLNRPGFCGGSHF